MQLLYFFYVIPYMQLDAFTNLVPSGSPPKNYGLIKMHKENMPLRPVVKI